MEIIKESIVHYKGSGGPFIPTAYGYLRLTKTTLILDYYLLGICGYESVHGIWKRRKEIPIKNIKSVKKNFRHSYNFLCR
jgi:hypothetical protein